MEEQNSQKKGVSVILPFLIILVLFVVDLVLAYAVLYPEKLWKNKYFPVSPNSENIFSYGITQQLDLEVVDIQDFEDHNGDQGKQFIFRITLDDGEERTLEKYVITPDGTLDEFNKILLYWDPATSTWVSYDEKPDDVPAGINIGDMVTVAYNGYYEKGVQDISIKIQTVEHRSQPIQEVPNEQ